MREHECVVVLQLQMIMDCCILQLQQLQYTVIDHHYIYYKAHQCVLHITDQGNVQYTHLKVVFFYILACCKIAEHRCYCVRIERELLQNMKERLDRF
jgi:hypothetical protein